MSRGTTPSPGGAAHPTPHAIVAQPGPKAQHPGDSRSEVLALPHRSPGNLLIASVSERGVPSSHKLLLTLQPLLLAVCVASLGQAQPAETLHLSAQPAAPPAGVPRDHRVEGALYGAYGSLGGYICPLAGRRCVNGSCRTLGGLHVYPSATGSAMRPLSPITICVTGVGEGDTVTIDIRAPNLRLRRVQQTLLKPGTARMETLLPAGPPGRYEIAVTTATTRYVRTREVEAVERRALRFTPTPRAGETTLLGLVGFSPRRNITLHLYRLAWEVPGTEHTLARQHYRYRGTVRLRTDTQGMADATIRIDRRTPKGSYFVGTRPGDWVGGFDIGPAKSKSR